MTIIKMEIIEPKQGETMIFYNPFPFPIYIGGEKLKETQENLEQTAYRIGMGEAYKICAKEVYLYYPYTFNWDDQKKVRKS